MTAASAATTTASAPANGGAVTVNTTEPGGGVACNEATDGETIIVVEGNYWYLYVCTYGAGRTGTGL